MLMIKLHMYYCIPYSMNCLNCSKHYSITKYYMYNNSQLKFIHIYTNSLRCERKKQIIHTYIYIYIYENRFNPVLTFWRTDNAPRVSGWAMVQENNASYCQMRAHVFIAALGILTGWCGFCLPNSVGTLVWREISQAVK